MKEYIKYFLIIYLMVVMCVIFVSLLITCYMYVRDNGSKEVYIKRTNNKPIVLKMNYNEKQYWLWYMISNGRIEMVVYEYGDYKGYYIYKKKFESIIEYFSFVFKLHFLFFIQAGTLLYIYFIIYFILDNK